MINIRPVIMAGGVGTRLWPLSRKSLPKQFQKFFSKKSLFQETILRLSSTKKINILKPIILTNEKYRFIIRDQLNEINIKPEYIIIEPSSKNTSSPILASSLIEKNPNTLLLMLPSDHVVDNLDNFISDIEKVYLTASGGPFLNLKLNKFKKIKPHHALKHPKWKMGKKISVDSSTLMNKILELIEAQKLFNIPSNKLDIVIHPNSLVHAIITLKNGLSKLIYHETSMVIPLANAIFDNKVNIKDFYKKKIEPFNSNLNFSKVDKKKFPIINLKHKANLYPSTSIIINASNEILVDQFIRGKIPYLAISKVIMSILRDRNYKKNAIKRASNLNQIIKTDLWARKLTYKKIQKYV